MAELDDLLAARDDSLAVVISAVLGTAGVGKTALAVHWAHGVRDQFPDGQIYLDLRGYDREQPLQSGEALATLLRSLGSRDDDIPPRLEDRMARYRSLVDGRRILLLLDNASSADQVRPLLPGTPSCFVVLTSRDALGGLVVRHGARRVDLDVLSPTEATNLLRSVLSRRRVDADPTAAAALAQQCARLPLALRIAAEYLAAHPSLSLADLVVELNRHHLDLFDAGGDERTAVRSVFSWSYQHLPPPAARVFRLLGLQPAHDSGVNEIAALADVELSDARRQIDVLLRAHLIAEPGLGRTPCMTCSRRTPRNVSLWRRNGTIGGAPSPVSSIITGTPPLLRHAVATRGASCTMSWPSRRDGLPSSARRKRQSPG
ncbi:NB-ARC domain-containing protein [Virgisporangium aurantiacum]|nr:NB-ARC domain-containing protein [Virgisporangium aurantiacum]